MCLKYYKNLKKLREEKNLSIKQLSENTGISELIIKNIEEQLTTNHGINKISILSKALDVSIDDFINKEL